MADNLKACPFCGTSEHRSIGQGMAVAAGIIMNSWGDTVQAGEILGGAGYDSIEDMKNDGVDQYDIDLCAPVFDGGEQP